MVQESLPRFIRPGDAITAGRHSARGGGAGRKGSGRAQARRRAGSRERGDGGQARCDARRVTADEAAVPAEGAAVARESRGHDGLGDAGGGRFPTARRTPSRSSCRSGATRSRAGSRRWSCPSRARNTPSIGPRTELATARWSKRSISSPSRSSYRCCARCASRSDIPTVAPSSASPRSTRSCSWARLSARRGFRDELRVSDFLSSLRSSITSGGGITQERAVLLLSGKPGLGRPDVLRRRFPRPRKGAGYAVPQELLARPIAALKEALRSDYGILTQGYGILERSMALCTLDDAGAFDTAYGRPSSWRWRRTRTPTHRRGFGSPLMGRRE